MKTKRSKSLLILASILGLAFGTQLPVRADHQDGAIMHLQQAKSAKNPAEHLEEAKKNLPTEDKTARPHVDEAIAAAQKNDTKAMKEHIDMAIKELKREKKEEKK